MPNPNRSRSLALVGVAAVLTLAASAPAASIMTIKKAEGGRYDVFYAGKLFTSLHTQGFPKPILYPVIGPNGEKMTRNYPMKPGVEGEAKDHPHHQSLWYTHGNVNGIDFWALGKGKIVAKVAQVAENGSQAWITLNDDWIGPDGKLVLTDTMKITFHSQRAVGSGGPEYSIIDYEITLHASEGDVTFGDTKEGSMGIRTNAKLRTDKGAATVNSEGVEGKDVWGKRAKWVDYSNEIEGKVVGVAIFDHPSNPRHPTTWHARTYGLVAANPFGIHDFEKKPAGTGDFKIEKGKSVTFRYRFVFHQGDATKIGVAKLYEQYAGEKGR